MDYLFKQWTTVFQLHYNKYFLYEKSKTFHIKSRYFALLLNRIMTKRSKILLFSHPLKSVLKYSPVCSNIRTLPLNLLFNFRQWDIKITQVQYQVNLSIKHYRVSLRFSFKILEIMNKDTDFSKITRVLVRGHPFKTSTPPKGGRVCSLK